MKSLYLLFLIFAASCYGQATGDLYYQRKSSVGYSAGWLTPESGKVLSWNGSGQLVNLSASGTGTVTSVGISSPAGITVGSSPVTASGTITLTLDADLVSIASLSTTAYGRSILEAADAAGLRAAAGLGSLATISPTGTKNNTTFLRGDDTWAVPPGTGTVTTVSVVTANGVSGTVANASTTPALTLNLGNITPSSIVSPGVITGGSLGSEGDLSVLGGASVSGDLTVGGSITGYLTSAAAAAAYQAKDADLDSWAALTPGGLATLSAVTTSQITDGTIVNADVSGSAAIALSKLAQDPLDRTLHTGTQAASTISDFASASRAQTEAELVAGTNITITPASSGATRTLTISASGGGGSPGGSSGQIQGNSSGSFAGIPGTAFDGTSGAITHSQGTGGATIDHSLILASTTAATSGNQKWSPGIRLRANGYGTTGAASQTVDIDQVNKPTQGTSPTGAWTLTYAINGGTPTEFFRIPTTGVIENLRDFKVLSMQADYYYGYDIVTIRNDSNTGTRGIGLGTLTTLGWGSMSGNTLTGRDALLGRQGAANIRQGAADAAAPVAQTFSTQSVAAGTSNTAGQTRTFSGSQGTGTGAGGNITFTVAPAGSSGTAQNALTEAFTIRSDKAVYISNATGTPGTPTGGGVLFVDGGALKFIGSSGTVTTIANP